MHIQCLIVSMTVIISMTVPMCLNLNAVSFAIPCYHHPLSIRLSVVECDIRYEVRSH